jgi:hypothetical protein
MLEYLQVVPERALDEAERKRFLEVMKETVLYFEASIETPLINGVPTMEKAEFGAVETSDDAKALVVALRERVANCSFSIVTRHDEVAARFVPHLDMA